VPRDRIHLFFEELVHRLLEIGEAARRLGFGRGRRLLVRRIGLLRDRGESGEAGRSRRQKKLRKTHATQFLGHFERGMDPATRAIKPPGTDPAQARIKYVRSMNGIEML
jgi:hypothetical protein